jgi:hypothetical protein
MELSEARKSGLFSCRIDIGEFFGLDPEAEWVKMREATAGELAQMSGNDGKNANETFMKILPSLILESGFTVEGAPAKAEDVAKIITDKGTLYGHVITEWQKSLPLAKRKSAASAK